MPRNARILLEGKICHHIVQGINKEYIFEEKDDKNKYLSLFKKYYKKYNIDIICYCIMDNHTHLILYSNSIKNISSFLEIINSAYGRYYNKKHNRVGYVFRNRFKSILIKTRKQLCTCIKYIHMNPVKANIVKRESEYEYSSYNDYINNSGFLNQRILDFLFLKSQDYIETFKEIPYQNIYDNKVRLEEKFYEFMEQEKLNIERTKKDKKLLKEFIMYLEKNRYEYSKKELATIFEVSRATLYRFVKKVKEENESII